MTTLRIYNLTNGYVSFPGGSDVPPVSRKSFTVDEWDLDPVWEGLAVRGPLMGIVPTSADEVTELPLILGGVTASRLVTGGDATLTAAQRAAVVLDGNRTITLMAASAVPAGTYVRTMIDTAGGVTDSNVVRGGADTINGAAPAIPMSVTAPLVTLISDGVSNWTTV
jgi:hypothetical protein